MGKGVHPTSKLDEKEGYHCQGQPNRTICSNLRTFCPGKLELDIGIALNPKHGLVLGWNWTYERVWCVRSTAITTATNEASEQSGRDAIVSV